MLRRVGGSESCVRDTENTVFVEEFLGGFLIFFTNKKGFHAWCLGIFTGSTDFVTHGPGGSRGGGARNTFLFWLHVQHNSIPYCQFFDSHKKIKKRVGNDPTIKYTIVKGRL